MRRSLVLVTVAFALFTAWVVGQTGLLGFFEQLLASPAGWQVLADVTLALFLVLGWIRRDARATGRPFWPYVALTIAAGSLGPLTYLLLRPARTSPSAATGT